MNEVNEFLPSSPDAIEATQADIQHEYTRIDVLKLIADSTEMSPNAEYTSQEFDLETAE